VLLGQLVDRAAVEELDAKNWALLQVCMDGPPSLSIPLARVVCLSPQRPGPCYVSACLWNVSKAPQWGGRWLGGWVGVSEALAAVRQLSVEREVLLGQLVDRAAVEELDAKNRALLQVRVDVSVVPFICTLSCPGFDCLRMCNVCKQGAGGLVR
jgi:hypothetical protein